MLTGLLNESYSGICFTWTPQKVTAKRSNYFRPYRPSLQHNGKECQSYQQRNNVVQTSSPETTYRKKADLIWFQFVDDNGTFLMLHSHSETCHIHFPESHGRLLMRYHLLESANHFWVTDFHQCPFNSVLKTRARYPTTLHSLQCILFELKGVPNCCSAVYPAAKCDMFSPQSICWCERSWPHRMLFFSWSRGAALPDNRARTQRGASNLGVVAMQLLQD